MLVNARRVNDTAGKPKRIEGTKMDVIERKRAEAALAESQVLLNAIINSTTDMIWAVEPKTLGLISFNQAFIDYFREQLGVPAAQGMRPEDLLPTDALVQTWHTLYRRAMEEGSYTTEYPMATSRKTLQLSFNLLKREGAISGISVFARDVTERKRAEEAMRESKEKFQALVESTSDCIWEIDTDGRFTYCSPQIKEIWGYEPQEMMGKTPFDQMKPEDREETIKSFRALAESPRPVRGLHVSSIDSSGRDIFLEVSFIPIWDNNHRLCGYRGISRDITKPKRSEQALRASEETYRTVVENAGIGIVVIQGDTIAYANPRALSVIGLTREQVTGSSFADVVHPDDLQDVLALHARLLAGEITPPAYELRLKVAGQGEKWVLANTVPFQWDGRPGTLNFLTDITEQRRAEKALRESEARFRTLVQQASEGIALVDEQGSVLEWNKVMEQISGIPRTQAVGRPIWDIQLQMAPVERRSPLVSNSFKAAFSRGLRTGDLPQAGKRVEVIVQSTNGERKAVEQTTFSIKTEFGYRFGSVVLDITERKRAEAEREQLLEQVRAGHEQLQALSRRLVQAQEEERRNIARELHDEIGQVLTGLKLMLDTSLRLPAEVIAGRLQEAQALVGHLIDQVQELALDLRPTMLDDYGLLPALTWHLERFKTQTGIDVAFEHCGLEQRLPPTVETAAYRIAQEALTNVARHAAVNHAALSLTVDGEELRIRIADQGKGFDVKTVVAAGTSTGLSGMRERASALGGRLTVEGEPGGGTRITAVLPFSRSLAPRDKPR